MKLECLFISDQFVEARTPEDLRTRPWGLSERDIEVVAIEPQNKAIDFEVQIRKESVKASRIHMDLIDHEAYEAKNEEVRAKAALEDMGYAVTKKRQVEKT